MEVIWYEHSRKKAIRGISRKTGTGRRSIYINMPEIERLILSGKNLTCISYPNKRDKTLNLYRQLLVERLKREMASKSVEELREMIRREKKNY